MKGREGENFNCLILRRKELEDDEYLRHERRVGMVSSSKTKGVGISISYVDERVGMVNI